MTRRYLYLLASRQSPITGLFQVLKRFVTSWLEKSVIRYRTVWKSQSKDKPIGVCRSARSASNQGETKQKGNELSASSYDVLRPEQRGWHLKWSCHRAFQLAPGRKLLVRQFRHRAATAFSWLARSISTNRTLVGIHSIHLRRVAVLIVRLRTG